MNLFQIAYQQYEELNWSDRYAPWWEHTSRFTRSVMMDRCCCNPRHAANQTHHAFYGTGSVALALLIGIAFLLQLLPLPTVADLPLCAMFLLGIALIAWSILRGKPMPFAGLEIPFWQVFPMCEACHFGIAHHCQNWFKDRDDPVWGYRNYPHFLWSLRLRAWLILLAIWFVPLAALTITIMVIVSWFSFWS